MSVNFEHVAGRWFREGDLTWIQSQPCNVCYPQVDLIFDPSESSTYRKIACSSPLCREVAKSTVAECLAGSCRYTFIYGDSITLGTFSTEKMTVNLSTGGKSEVQSALDFFDS